MHLEIEQRENEGILILDLKGKLILGPEDSYARQHILPVLERGHHRLILNLKELTDIDTTGLGTLTFCATKAKEAGGRLVLINLSRSHTKLSDIFKLSTAFEIYPTELDAINSFFPERAVPRYDILEFIERQERNKQIEEQRT